MCKVRITMQGKLLVLDFELLKYILHQVAHVFEKFYKLAFLMIALHIAGKQFNCLLVFICLLVFYLKKKSYYYF
jgi:hypothetical protein